MLSPQPFNLREVIVCDQTYPQPEISDRLYIDKNVFFINIPQEVRPESRAVLENSPLTIQQDGMYESLQIPYEIVTSIQSEHPKGKKTHFLHSSKCDHFLIGKPTLVTVHLKSAPKLGDQKLGTSGEAPRLRAEIQDKDWDRFNKAIEHRKLVCCYIDVFLLKTELARLLWSLLPCALRLRNLPFHSQEQDWTSKARKTASQSLLA